MDNSALKKPTQDDLNPSQFVDGERAIAHTAGYLRNETSPLRNLSRDQYAFALSSSDALAAMTLDCYASLLRNFVDANHSEAAVATATSKALRNWPEKKIPGFGEHGTGYRYGLTVLGTLLDDRESLLNRLDDTAPAYVITYDSHLPMLHRVAAAQAIHFWAFHAEIQNVPELKVRSAATLAQCMWFYGSQSATPSDVLNTVRQDDIPVFEE